MNDETQKQLLERLDVLASKLGVGAEALWSMLLRQAQISFWTDMVIVALTATGWWFFFKKLLPWARRNDEDGVVPCIVVGGLCFLVTLALIICMENIVASLINPEYWAFNKVLRIIKRD
jgi:hypothetical protein